MYVYVPASENISQSNQVVEMKEISPTLANGEHQPGLESQGRAASMPRLAAETQVREGSFTGNGKLTVNHEFNTFSLLVLVMLFFEATCGWLFG